VGIRSSMMAERGAILGLTFWVVPEDPPSDF
jgi:hypothetical protein